MDGQCRWRNGLYRILAIPAPSTLAEQACMLDSQPSPHANERVEWIMDIPC